jgi:L,D-transpeptidase ErfK/SrfK
MNVQLKIVTMIVAFLYIVPAYAGVYSKQLCKKEGFSCYQVKRGDTWNRLIPDSKHQLMVKKLNRTNTHLNTHRIIAMPMETFWKRNLYDFSPLPYRANTEGQRRVIISINDHAFGAYDELGRLVKWGPISAGRGYCPDTKSFCNTARGEFEVYRKGGEGCKSGKYPLETNGGAPMPYCMFFYHGYAMHGSSLPGHHASHGCVRLFYDDARWLNQEFTAKRTAVHVVDEF